MAIESILHEREYQTDEVIFRQDEPGMGMYIIASGTVTIISEPSSMQWSELGEGEFFGEIALLDEHPRSASAIAKTPVQRSSDSSSPISFPLSIVTPDWE